MSDHVWKVGDLCTSRYGGIGYGMIYRVSRVEGTPYRPGGSLLDRQELKIIPVTGVLCDIKGRKPRTLSARYCHPLSLVDLASEYHALGVFIAEEAKRLGT